MKKKKTNPVYSTRIDEEILSAFKETCEKFNVPHNYIITEYMKNFVVANAQNEAYNKAVLYKSELNNILED